MDWFYARGDMQRGPVSEDELRDLIKNGTISDETRVWKEGMGDWLTVSEIPELRNGQLKKSGDSDTESKAEEEASTPRESPAERDKTHQRPEMRAAAQTPDLNGPMPSTYAAQAIIGLVIGVLCCTPVAAPAVVAIVKGSKVKALYDSGDFDGALEASGKAKYWCNITGIALVVVVILWIILLATGTISEQ